MIGTNGDLPRWFRRVFASAAIFLLAGLPGAAEAKGPARFDHSGFVKSPGEYTYTVKCDPGEYFDVEVTSSHPVEVSVSYKRLYDTRWAYRLEQASESAISHRLRHAAPSEKPAGPMKYWHYEVRVYPMTNEKTDYSLSVVRSEAPKEASRHRPLCRHLETCFLNTQRQGGNDPGFRFCRRPLHDDQRWARHADGDGVFHERYRHFG